MTERILSGGHRTMDAANADWYWVPVALRHLWRNEDTVELHKVISQSWPMWNTTFGARHLLLDSGEPWVMPAAHETHDAAHGCETSRVCVVVDAGDWPICERSEEFRATYTNVSFLVHWGSVRKRNIRYATGCFRKDQASHHLAYGVIGTQTHPPQTLTSSPATPCLVGVAGCCYSSRKCGAWHHWPGGERSVVPRQR